MTCLSHRFDEENVYDLNAILHPGSVFDHPRDVLTDATLSHAEKRAILARWASDAARGDVVPGLAGHTRGQGAGLDRRHPGGAFESGPFAAHAAWRQASQAQIDRTNRRRMKRRPPEWID